MIFKANENNSSLVFYLTCQVFLKLIFHVFLILSFHYAKDQNSCNTWKQFSVYVITYVGGLAYVLPCLTFQSWDNRDHLKCSSNPHAKSPWGWRSL